MNNEFTKGIEVVVGTLIVNNNTKKILLTKSPKWSNKWCIQGGHIEPGESILEAAVREAKEETGLEVNPVTILLSQELINPADFYRPAHFISFICLLHTSIDTLRLDERELSMYKWVTPDKALELELISDEYEVIKKYMDYLIDQQPY